MNHLRDFPAAANIQKARKAMLLPFVLHLENAAAFVGVVRCQSAAAGRMTRQVIQRDQIEQIPRVGFHWAFNRPV